MSAQTLLGVWAHPDDEAYLSAGLMLDHARRGDRVVVVTATPGEHGTSDPIAWPPDVLAAHRRLELCDALAAVGVFEHHVLGYEDGRCDTVDGTADIARFIDALRPDIIVTFGPDGMTGHPDHRAVSRWTTDAWNASEASAELWYATLTPAFHAEWGHLNTHVGLWSEQPAPPSTAPSDLCHVVQLSGERLDAKIAALHAHRSQTAPLEDLVGSDTYRRWWSVEAFRAAVRLDPELGSGDGSDAGLEALVP